MILSPDRHTSLQLPCIIHVLLPACLPACLAAGNCIAKWNHRWFAPFLLLAQMRRVEGSPGEEGRGFSPPGGGEGGGEGRGEGW